MRLTSVEASEFRSHHELELDLGSMDHAVIVGANGAGKSSILAAIEFCLFGGKADELLNFDADRGGVTLVFERNGMTWRVSRGRARGRKSWLVVERQTPGGWESLTKSSINDTQAWLESEVIGMDRDAFRASVYVPQGEAGAFAALNPGGRKELLAKLLDLDGYEEWRLAAATERRALESQVGLLATNLTQLDERLREVTWDPAQIAELEIAIAKHGEALEALDAEMSLARAREKAMQSQLVRESLLARMDDLRQRAERSKAQAALREQLQAQAAEAQAYAEQERGMREAAQRHQEHLVAMSKVSSLEDQARFASTALRAAMAAASRSAESRLCPTCGQTLDAGAEARARAKVQEEVELLRERHRSLMRDLEVARAATPPSEYDSAEHERLRTALRNAEAAAARRDAIEPEDLNALRQAYKELKAQLPPEGSIEGDLPDDVSRKQNETRERMLQAERQLAEARRDEAEATRTRAQIERVSKQLTEMQVDAEALGHLAQAFSRSGIPAMMLDNAVAVVESAANDLLDDLGAPYRVRLATQRQKKTGGVTDTLEIVVDAGGRERTIETFSGGEKYRIHVALRMGLAAMVAGRSGSQLDFLLVDEPTDLDATGMRALAGVLTGLRKQVVLVSHVESLVDEFPQRIVVTRDSDVSPSRVEVS